MFVDIKNIEPPSGTLRYPTPLFGYHRFPNIPAIRAGLSFKVVSHININTQGVEAPG